MNAIKLASEAETRAFGAALASQLRMGDTLLLDGTLGAGKTTLAQAIIQVLSPSAIVTSPTFNVVQPYRVVTAHGDSGQCLHADLYRLNHETELHELGLLDAMGTDICIVEWPNKLGAHLPNRYIYCGMTHDSSCNGRELMLRWQPDAEYAALAAWWHAQTNIVVENA